MKGSEICQFFKTHTEFSPFFLGVFSVQDSLPKIKPETYCVLNSSSHYDIPGHWFVLGRDRNNTVECFDSLGTSRHYIGKNVTFEDKGDELQFNEKQVQMDYSTACGLFCIFFIINRAVNPDLPFGVLFDFLFTDSCLKNEEEVTNFYDELMQKVKNG